MNNLSSFLKYYRKKAGLTQEELSIKAGVGIRFIRELEQGKKTVQLDKVDQVLKLFGFELIPGKQQLDPYDIFWNYLDKPVKITLKNREIKFGIITKEIIDNTEGKITAWQFVSNTNAMKYLQKINEENHEIIFQNDIQEIDNQ
jgi:y4mF family transcriptional regulator